MTTALIPIGLLYEVWEMLDPAYSRWLEERQAEIEKETREAEENLPVGIQEEILRCSGKGVNHERILREPIRKDWGEQTGPEAED